jgi:hypothetical protein
MPDTNRVQEIWDFETLGIKEDPSITQADEDKAALEAFNSSIQKVNGRYRVSWPWRDQNPELPSNFGMAFSRLPLYTNSLLILS